MRVKSSLRDGLLLALGLTSISYFAFVSTGNDDPYLTYWIAEQIKQGALNGYNGAPFEQTSSLLHAAFLATFSKLFGAHIPDAAKILEFTVSVATLSISYHLISRRRGRARAFAGTLSLACLPVFAYWSWGGLETSMVVLFAIGQSAVLANVLRSRSPRSIMAAGVFNTFYVFLRPEALVTLPLQVVIAMLFALTLRLPSVRSWWAFLSPARAIADAFFMIVRIALIPVLSGFVVRYCLFGRIMPSTVYAKSLWHGSALERLRAGADYLLINPVDLGIAGGIGIAVLVACAIKTTLGSRSILSLSMASIFTAQMIAVLVGGGDCMGMGRFLVAPLFLAVLNIFAYSSPSKLANMFPAILLSLSSVFYVLTAASPHLYAKFRMHNKSYFPLWHRSEISRFAWFQGRPKADSMLTGSGNTQLECLYPHESEKLPNLRDCTFLRAVDDAESRHKIFRFQPGDRILSYQAGMVPYYLIKSHPGLKFVDPVGLGSPERTSLKWASSYASDTRKAGVSNKTTLRFVDRMRPEYVFLLGTSLCRDLAIRGYDITVSVLMRSGEYLGIETLYTRKDRVRNPAHSSRIGCADLTSGNWRGL